MTFFHTLSSEWSKLRSTKAIYWSTLLFVAFSVGLSLAISWGTRSMVKDSALNMDNGVVIPESQYSVLYAFGFSVLLIQAAMVVTAEYRHNFIQETFLATPNRTIVALAKWVMTVLFFAVLTFLSALAAIFGAKAIAKEMPGTELDVFGNPDSVRYLWALPLIAAALVTLSLGIGFLVRQTAGAIAILLIWWLAFENIIKIIPKVGARIAKFGPMTNLNAFYMQKPIDDWWLGTTGSLYYFLAWCVAIFIIGTVVMNRRDA